jgi:hypothetical protein
MKIYQNSRNRIELEDFSSLIETSEEDSNEVPIALQIQPNDVFRSTGPIYQPLSSFNNKRTSTESNHYHELNLIGSFIDGEIGSFVNIASATVEFEVVNSDLFGSSIVQKDGTLFKGARIRFFNPEFIGIEYFSEVIEHTSTTMTVKLLNNNSWDFDDYSQSKISETWLWEIDATNYGYTKNTFYDDFVTDSQVVTENIPIESQFVKVVDTSNMVDDDKILIISSADKSETNFIKSVVDSTTIELQVVASNSYFVANTVQVKVLRDEFSNTHEHMVRNNQVETISVEDYLNRGLPSQHSHRNIALIDVISDMQEEGDIFAVGSSSFVYNSGNNGEAWEKLVDLNDFVEENIEVEGIVNIDTVSGSIVAGTTNGEIFSTGGTSAEILPLNQPEVN